VTTPYTYIEGPGQRYVGLGDVTLWLAKQANDLAEAYAKELHGQASPPVLHTLYAKQSLASQICMDFVKLHNVGSAEIVHGDTHEGNK